MTLTLITTNNYKPRNLNCTIRMSHTIPVTPMNFWKMTDNLPIAANDNDEPYFPDKAMRA